MAEAKENTVNDTQLHAEWHPTQVIEEKIVPLESIQDILTILSQQAGELTKSIGAVQVTSLENVKELFEKQYSLLHAKFLYVFLSEFAKNTTAKERKRQMLQSLKIAYSTQTGDLEEIFVVTLNCSGFSAQVRISNGQWLTHETTEIYMSYLIADIYDKMNNIHQPPKETNNEIV